MAKASGRLFLIKKNTVTIGGLRSKSITVSGEPIDVQDQSDGGFATFLPGILNNQRLEFTGDGYEEDQVMRDLGFGAASGKFLSDITIEFPNGSNTISGDCVLTSYSETGELADGQTFNFSIVFDGGWTYT